MKMLACAYFTIQYSTLSSQPIQSASKCGMLQTDVFRVFSATSLPKILLACALIRETENYSLVIKEVEFTLSRLRMVPRWRNLEKIKRLKLTKRTSVLCIIIKVKNKIYWSQLLGIVRSECSMTVLFKETLLREESLRTNIKERLTSLTSRIIFLPQLLMMELFTCMTMNLINKSVILNPGTTKRSRFASSSKEPTA